jgi:hypothetical protein
VDELDYVDWCSLFSSRGVDQCVDLIYETIWSCFERHLPTRYSGCEQKLPWMTRELTSLKNNKTKASKKSKDSEQRCLNADAIDNCVCEHLREKFFSLREYQQQQHALAYTVITAQESRRRSRAIRRPFFQRKSALATHQLCILEVVWPLAPKKSVIYTEFMSGWLLILPQNTFWGASVHVR